MKAIARTIRSLKSVFSMLALGSAILSFPAGHLRGQELGAVEPLDDVNQIFQYFAPSTIPKARLNSGAYLWIPPAAPQIRAVIVGIQNGLPIVVLQNPAIRAVCREYGIAQILLTPNGSEIGPVMLKDLNYDVTNPEVTAVYDRYLQRLADLSGHPELVTAPIVPMAHSAYCAFPFAAAMRDPAHCLAALPIKAGLPDLYAFFGQGGKAFKPDPSLCLRNVPILFINSGSQETVSWSAYPHDIGGPIYQMYRHDHDDNPGVAYEPRNDMIGINWDMAPGHFDMLPRDFEFTANWLAAVAEARLPAKPGDPLKDLTLRDGWLINPVVPVAGDLPANFPLPAPYLQYKGPRSKAAWYPTEALARTEFQLIHDEPRKKIEMFTFLDPAGKPISLEESSMAEEPNAQLLLRGQGLLTLTSYHFTAPFLVWSESKRDHEAHPEKPYVLENKLFPGQTTLPVSGIPLQYDPCACPLVLVNSEMFKDARGVPETRFTLRWTRNRMTPDASLGFFAIRAYDQGNAQFAASGRTCAIKSSMQDFDKSAAAQTVDFPKVPDAPADSPGVELKAKSSSGLPVDYFVLKGPGIIRNGAFIPTDVPAGLRQPMEVTVGAYQVGLFKEPGGFHPSATVYQTFRLLP